MIFTTTLIARGLPGPRTIDDAYITFRYARNILAGNGFVFNPGEHVLGTTTPLYTILLVLWGAVFGGQEAPFPQIALWINAIADGITCVLLFLLGRRSGFNSAAIGAALVWAIAPFSVTFAIGGMETSLYVLLLTGLVYAHIHQRRLIVALLASLSLLTRPDALILLFPLAVDRLISRSGIKSLLLELLVFSFPTLTWVIFATIYFGSPLPHSILAKSLAYHLPPSAALVRLLQHYATPFLEHLTLGIPAIAVGLVLYPFLFIIGARKAISREPHLWPWIIYPWFYFIIFALANPLLFRWYLTPPLPPYIWTILVGIEALAYAAFAHKGETASLAGVKSPELVSGVRFLLVIVAPLILTLRGWSLHPDHGLNRPAPQMAWYQLELLYRQAADFLSPEIDLHPSPPVLAAGDVGVLGYYTRARILDTVGLNSPLSTQYYPLGPEYYEINYAIPPDLIIDRQPDYLVILEVYGRRGLLKDERFQKLYRLLLKIPTDIYGSDGMLIFKRMP